MDVFQVRLTNFPKPDHICGTRSRRVTFSQMDRIFLAIIVSGLLLAATSMSLLVATGGGTTVAELKVSPSPPAAQEIRPQISQKAILARDDSAR